MSLDTSPFVLTYATTRGVEAHKLGLMKQLQLMFSSLRNENIPQLSTALNGFVIYVTLDGMGAIQMGSKPLSDRVTRRRIDRENYAQADLSISLETMHLPETEFRKRFGDLVRLAAVSLADFVHSRGVDLDVEPLLAGFDRAIAEYLAQPSPQSNGESS